MSFDQQAELPEDQAIIQLPPPPEPEAEPEPDRVPRFWHYATWRGGFPFGLCLFLTGVAVPGYNTVGGLGFFILVLATTRVIVRKWIRDVRKEAGTETAADDPDPAPAAPAPAAAETSEQYAERSYYADWVGTGPVAGPYPQPVDDTAHM